MDVNFFSEEYPEEIVYRPIAKKAKNEDMPTIQCWAKQLQDTMQKQLSENGMIDITSTSIPVEPTVNTVSGSSQSTNVEVPTESSMNMMDIPPSVEEAINTIREPKRSKYNILNHEQHRAHDIIAQTLCTELSGSKIILSIVHLWLLF